MPAPCRRPRRRVDEVCRTSSGQLVDILCCFFFLRKRTSRLGRHHPTLQTHHLPNRVKIFFAFCAPSILCQDWVVRVGPNTRVYYHLCVQNAHYVGDFSNSERISSCVGALVRATRQFRDRINSGQSWGSFSSLVAFPRHHALGFYERALRSSVRRGRCLWPVHIISQILSDLYIRCPWPRVEFVLVGCVRCFIRLGIPR